jgi:hypothetical protein
MIENIVCLAMKCSFSVFKLFKTADLHFVPRGNVNLLHDEFCVMHFACDFVLLYCHNFCVHCLFYSFMVII